MNNSCTLSHHYYIHQTYLFTPLYNIMSTYFVSYMHVYILIHPCILGNTVAKAQRCDSYSTLMQWLCNFMCRIREVLHMNLSQEWNRMVQYYTKSSD